MRKARACYVTVGMTCPYCKQRFTTRRSLKQWADRLSPLEIAIEVEDEAELVHRQVVRDASKHIEKCGGIR